MLWAKAFPYPYLNAAVQKARRPEGDTPADMSCEEAPNTVRVACSDRKVLRLLMALLLTTDMLLLVVVVPPLLVLLLLVLLLLLLLLARRVTARPALLPCPVPVLPASL